jgi:hypothetical protein
MLSDDVMPPLPVCDMRMGASYDMARSQNNDLFADREKPIERFLLSQISYALCSQLGAVREKTLDWGSSFRTARNQASAHAWRADHHHADTQPVVGYGRGRSSGTSGGTGARDSG